MKINIDGTETEMTYVNSIEVNYAFIETEDGDFFVATDSEVAGEYVADRWRDMLKYDKSEFKALIGNERLLQWVMGESDSFGISSLEEFFEKVAQVPEEDFGYDGEERDVKSIDDEAKEELGFTPTVAYRTH